MPKMTVLILVAYCLALAVSPFQTVQAAPQPDYQGVTKEIPQTPSAPPKLTRKIPEDPFHCKRRFIYQGKALECDSAVQQDGERLRPILERSPAAIAELNTYQENRRNIRKAAYVSSAGLLLALAAYMFNSTKEEADKSKVVGAVLYGGLAISAGSLAYSISLKGTNDTHIGKAVDIYNRENPDNPIELQFSTGFNF